MGAESMDRIGLRRKPKQERSIQRLDLILAASAKIIAEKGVSAMRMTRFHSSSIRRAKASSLTEA
ncbi:hypothetical protein ACC754_42870, partial [Rhizobium johnstonii]